ncbi:hypothetical protein BB561_000289 [Smittium simulii]|uniref:Serine hydrolase domain-containing protein n=1 Tax=Smittium simulii TaxID=133385 RepID=A0A2T9YZT9_9FUNG|nr:hypothetical protein BB561_000289 [Smittium simulii]
MSATKRVLCLHGYSQNAIRLKTNMGAIRKALKGTELIYTDAPHIASQPRPDQVLPEGKPLGWWNMTSPEIWRDTMSSLKSILSFMNQNGPFDGLLGFSQGAAMASILLGILDYKSIAHKELSSLSETEQAAEINFREFLSQLAPLVDLLGDSAKFSFVVFGGGFVTNEQVCFRLLADKTTFDIRSLHIMGKTDTIIIKERSMELTKLFINPEIIEHDGGHYLPYNKNYTTLYNNFISKL